MSDNYQLEVRVGFPFVDDAVGELLRKQLKNLDVVTNSTRLAASASMFSVSKALVGSSNARMPQFWPKESESASRMMMEASIF